MRAGLILLLIFASYAQADWLKAMLAYENKDFTTARAEFKQLIELANDGAAFNLGVMAYNGEGQEKDVVEAAAYFQLADSLQHPSATAVLTSVLGNMTEPQAEQAELRYRQLQQKVVLNQAAQKVISYDDPTGKRQASQPLKRTNPRYPVDAVLHGQFGYVALRFLVDPKGRVQAVDTLDAYPENVFEREAIQAVKAWRYTPTGKPELKWIRLDFALEGGVKVNAVERLVQQKKLWDYAFADSPRHQEVLGTLLELIELQSGNRLWIDKSLSYDGSPPDFSVFNRQISPRIKLDGFDGAVVVKVDQQGVVLEEVNRQYRADSTITTLLGQKLLGNITAPLYRISADNYTRKVSVTPMFAVPETMSSRFWWDKAARNGDKRAQRILAAYDRKWEYYLLNQENPEVMAWSGTRMILDGQREQGMQLLEQAIAQNYEPAKEMKKQFM